MKASNDSLLPDVILTEPDLDDYLTRPRQVLKDFIRTVSSPLVILGAGGKMGPTLAVLAKRAAQEAGHALDVIAVSRFSDESPRRWLDHHGISTRIADLLNRTAVQALPESANVVSLIGLKFGTSQNPAQTWAVNTVASAHIAERYANSSLVVLSTGNVYPMVSAENGGAHEHHALTPLGEYANAAVARERVFEYFSAKNHTPMALLRLIYAVELRYGILVDIARKVWSGETIDLSNGFFNCIWQGDANEAILRSLSLVKTPAEAWNLALPRVLRVRDVAVQFGEILGKLPRFSGQDGDMTLIANSSKLWSALGEPATPLDTVLRWISHWVKTNGRSLNKPTHFEVHDGRY